MCNKVQPKENVVAMYRHRESEVVVEIITGICGTLYVRYRDNGHVSTMSFTKTKLEGLQRASDSKEIVWLLTPATNYHVWHIAPNGKVIGGIFEDGDPTFAIFDHSQGTWDDKLRDVDPKLVGTFPTIAS